MKLTDTGLTPVIIESLRRYKGITTTQELSQITLDEFLKVPGVGKKTIAKQKWHLADCGVRFK